MAVGDFSRLSRPIKARLCGCEWGDDGGATAPGDDLMDNEAGQAGLASQGISEIFSL